jgi:osomolarity two-component system response regulator SKN7
MYYFSQGMNDILPKPFTKEGLLGMLEKHLIHLRLSDAIRNHVPRGVGIPPLNDENFNQALMVASQSYTIHGQPSLIPPPNNEVAEQDEGKSNPFAGMGLSDEHYAMILQNFVTSGVPDSSAGESSSGNTPPIPIFGFGISSQSFSSGEKRPLDDGHDRDDNKRGRFEVIE